MATCTQCGDDFIPRARSDARGSPRSRCYTCSPEAKPGGAKVAVAAVGCRCQACASGLTPFTREHFARWALELVLDNGEAWVVEEFFLAYLDDLFAGGAMNAWTFQEGWLIVPEGNSKTTSMAGLALYHAEHVDYAWVSWAASARDQAEIGFIQASGFVERSPRYQLAPKMFKLHPGYRRIASPINGSRIQVFAADDRTGDGIIPTLAFLDELHRHRSLKLHQTWRGKLLKRGAQIAVISTAGEPGSEFEQMRENIRQRSEDVERTGAFVRASGGGVVLHEWALPEGGDAEDMVQVKSCNPFSQITLADLEGKFDSPTMTLSHWRRFVCNVPTRANDAAIEEAEWDAAKTLERIPAGAPVWLGLDVAWKADTTALVPLWIRDPEFRLLGAATILVPPRDGTSLDPNLVEHALLAVHKRNPVHTVVMDTSRAEQLGEWIDKNLGATVVDRSQTNTFAVIDYESFMEALRMGWLKHYGDPGLTRHVLNGVARLLPGGDSRFDRPAHSRASAFQDSRVIDALIAAAMVHASAAAELAAPKVPAPMIAFA